MGMMARYKVGDVVNVPMEYGNRASGTIAQVVKGDGNTWDYKVVTNLHYTGDYGWFSERQIRLGRE